MSLVGTQPLILNEYEQYTPAFKKRLSFHYAIIGISQTSDRNDITDFDEIMKMDLKYIEDWSMCLDIKLILKTVWVMMTGKGAV